MRALFMTIVLLFAWSIASLSVELYRKNSDKYETVVDELPKLKSYGGRIKQGVAKNKVYSDESKIAGLEGVVVVDIYISSTGNVDSLAVKKSVDALLDQDALKTVKFLNDWKPAKKNGENSACLLSVAVEYKLSASERDMVQQLQPFVQKGKLPMFVLNGRVVEGILQIHELEIKSIQVIKGEKAIEKYGANAQNGVVVFTTKKINKHFVE